MTGGHGARLNPGSLLKQMYDKELYEHQKQNKICPSCGNPNDSNKVFCNECLKDKKLLYDWYKRNGICVRCGVRNAEPGRVGCIECLTKNKEQQKRRYDRLSEEKKDEIRKRNNKRIRSLKQERKQNGLCIDCGKPVSKRSTVYCVDCAIKNRKRSARNRKTDIPRNERPSYGMCYRCGAEIDSGKLCQSCTETSMKNLKIAIVSPKYVAQQNYLRKHNSTFFTGK